MLFKINEEHKTFLRVFITYGIHIWILIFISNIAIFYSIRFFIKASTTRTVKETPLVQTMDESPSPTQFPTPVPTAVGPVVDLSFSLPGIGTNGGNLKPTHPTRNVYIYLFSADANTSDRTVKPVYTIRTYAVYDNDPNSSTHTFFINKYVDLGVVKDGSYQIALQTPQSLRQLIRSPDPNAVGGQILDFPNKRFTILPSQTMITGDIYPLPNGDNFMDINDYNMLVNCHNVQYKSSKCADSAIVDLDDNGVVDGIDYNIMLANFRTLISMGLPVPVISVSPSGEPIKISPTIGTIVSTSPQKDKSASSSPVRAKTASGSSSPIIIFIIFIFVVAIISFAVFKFHLLKLLFPKKEENQSPPQTPSEDQSSDQNLDQTVDQPADQPAAPTVSKTPLAGAVEKTGYLKKVNVDAQKNGVWVTLADDNGITRGFYPKDDVTDGFVKIKGTMKNDQEYKPYIFITEIIPQE